MMIADAQVHIWTSVDPNSLNKQRYPAYSKDEVLKEMDAAGVDRVVLVPPSWEIVDSPDNRNIPSLEAARLHPDRFTVAGLMSFEHPKSPALIEGWLKRSGMRSMRLTFTTNGRHLADGLADWIWPELERAGIPVMVRTEGEFPLIGKVAERHPGLAIAIDHMAASHFVYDDAAFIHIPDLLALARFPNITVKASALPVYASDPYPYWNLHKYIRQVFDVFGPERMFWGSDLTRLTGTYRESVTLFTEALPWLSERDKALIMGETLCKWLRWKI